MKMRFHSLSGLDHLKLKVTHGLFFEMFKPKTIAAYRRPGLLQKLLRHTKPQGGHLTEGPGGLLLVAMPFVTSSYLLPVLRPGAISSNALVSCKSISQEKPFRVTAPNPANNTLPPKPKPFRHPLAKTVSACSRPPSTIPPKATAASPEVRTSNTNSPDMKNAPSTRKRKNAPSFCHAAPPWHPTAWRCKADTTRQVGSALHVRGAGSHWLWSTKQCARLRSWSAH